MGFLCVSFYSRRLYNEKHFSLGELLNIKHNLKYRVVFQIVRPATSFRRRLYPFAYFPTSKSFFFFFLYIGMSLKYFIDLFFFTDSGKKKYILIKVKRFNSDVTHFKGVFVCPSSTLILIISQTLPQNSYCLFQMQI